MSINGFGSNQFARIDGLEEIYANFIYTDSLEIGSTFNNQPINYFTGVTSNIQTQINNIVNTINFNYGRWGAFWDTTTQTNPTANAINLMTYNNSDASNNEVSVISNSRITVETDGIYNLQFSAQLTSSSSSSQPVYIWFRKNGTSIPASATEFALKGSNANEVAAWNYVLPLAANDYIEIAWSSPSTNVSIIYVGASGSIPSIPSVIASLTEVVGEGPTGETGATPNFSIGTVGSIPTGSTPTVTITGTELNPILNFELPQGPIGPQGIQGPEGPEGPRGPRGPQGDQAQSTIDAIAAATAAAASATAAALSAIDSDSAATISTAAASESSSAAADANLSAESALASADSAADSATAAQEAADSIIDKTQNILSVVPDISTEFIGSIICEEFSGPTVNINSIGAIDIGTTSTLNLGGGTNITLASDSEASLIAPIININSGVSAGGIINIGESLLDLINIQGLPFVNFNVTSFNQW